MSYDDGQQRSRVVVNTPTRREEVRTETTYAPDRSGISNGVIAAIVVGAVVLVTILFLFLMKNQQDSANDNTPVTATQPQQQPIIVQQPAQPAQQPIVVQQPGTTQPAPVVVQQSSGESTGSTAGKDDASIQSNIEQRLLKDSTLASLSISVVVTNGKVLLTGMVDSDQLKSRVERLAKTVSGVRDVENKITVMSTSH